MARYLHEATPHSEMQLRREGHLSIFVHNAEEILTRLLSPT